MRLKDAFTFAAILYLVYVCSYHLGATMNSHGGGACNLAEEPIDFVYYFVNGSDPDQQQLFAEMQGKTSGLAASASKNRYRDWGELRYSIRSVFMHAPWFRRIYLVLRNNDTQVPVWLDRNHERLSIVTHEQIFANASNLPTLSSNAIEANVHRIPGLSKRFVLMNDDFFFYRDVTYKQLFDTPTTHFVCLSMSIMPASDKDFVDTPRTATQVCAQRINKLLDAAYGRRQRRQECHAPQPVDVSLMEQLQRRYASEFRDASAAKFRSDTICPRLFYDQWLLESQQQGFSASARLWSLKNAFNLKLVKSAFITRAQFFLARWILNPLYLGINDDVSEDATEEEIAAIAGIFREFVDKHFSVRSPLELW